MHEPEISCSEDDDDSSTSVYVFGKEFCAAESICSNDDKSGLDGNEKGEGASKTSAEDSIHICISSCG